VTRTKYSENSSFTEEERITGDETMPNESDSQKMLEVNESKTVETLADERLDREAEDSAGKAERTEQRYDKSHDIFTK
jgi:hypothetical protein